MVGVASDALVIVETISLRNIRSYARLEFALEPGLVLVTGSNGAGKTNLLESLHVGTQGFSPRTRSDAQLLRFGEKEGRIALKGARGESSVAIELTLRTEQGKRAALNGAQLRTAEQLRHEVATLVFTPDRLVVVKGGPSVRRAYFDRTLARLFPARANLPVEYGGAVAQRNAALRRIAGGFSTPDALDPWTARVVELGIALVEARTEVIALLAPAFAETSEQLGLPSARLEYEGDVPTTELLDAAVARDLERGTTSVGPHLHDVRIVSGARDLRLYGSQGEQRVTVLALLLAEAKLVAERRGVPPLLLFDDVLSELDPARRRALADRVAGHGQTLITSTTSTALPVEPAQLLEVSPGEVRAA
jgi:DNA replication and repair protein RecF